MTTVLCHFVEWDDHPQSTDRYCPNQMHHYGPVFVDCYISPQMNFHVEISLVLVWECT